MLEVVEKLLNNIKRVMVGKNEVIELSLIALLCKGHILLEDVPGVGKTTLADALARSLACSFKRVQFTPDIMPSDITGYTMINTKSGESEYKPGACMTQILLADEINRTSPKTQSSLLEVMQEGQVTVDGVSYALPRPFMVLATQNPIDFVGTYPLPEAQMDRFFMRLSIGYPSHGEEVELLTRLEGKNSPIDEISAVCSAEDIIALQSAVSSVFVSDSVKNYIVAIVQQTRQHPMARLGASSRGSIALMRASQALALLNSRDYVLPDDVKALAQSTLSHRIILRPEAEMRDIKQEKVIEDVLFSVPVPGSPGRR